MTEWFQSITVVAVSSGIMLLLCNQKSKTKKYLEYLIGICVLCSMILPVYRAVGKIPKLLDSISVNANMSGAYQTDSEDLLIGILTDEIESSVKKDIARRFQVEVNRVQCNIEYNKADKEAVLCGLIITVSGDYPKIESDIAKYLKSLYDCDITVFKE
ncbi:MAG: hypothetical protein PUB34_05965 [Clostridia bacterium]|nr:hypothetical protein [Clostridia bacterium]